MANSPLPKRKEAAGLGTEGRGEKQIYSPSSSFSPPSSSPRCLSPILLFPACMTGAKFLILFRHCHVRTVVWAENRSTVDAALHLPARPNQPPLEDPLYHCIPHRYDDDDEGDPTRSGRWERGTHSFSPLLFNTCQLEKGGGEEEEKRRRIFFLLPPKVGGGGF